MDRRRTQGGPEHAQEQGYGLDSCCWQPSGAAGAALQPRLGSSAAPTWASGAAAFKGSLAVPPRTSCSACGCGWRPRAACSSPPPAPTPTQPRWRAASPSCSPPRSARATGVWGATEAQERFRSSGRRPARGRLAATPSSGKHLGLSTSAPSCCHVFSKASLTHHWLQAQVPGVAQKVPAGRHVAGLAHRPAWAGQVVACHGRVGRVGAGPPGRCAARFRGERTWRAAAAPAAQAAPAAAAPAGDGAGAPGCRTVEGCAASSIRWRWEFPLAVGRCHCQGTRACAVDVPHRPSACAPRSSACAT